MNDDDGPNIYHQLWDIEDRNERAKIMRRSGLLDGPPELMKDTFSGSGPDQIIGRIINKEKPDDQ